MSAFGYEDLHAMAAELGRPIGTLIALSHQNDPFYAGSTAGRRDGEWFSELWRRFGLDHGVHIRRIHYVMISQREPVLRVNGMQYENTIGSWDELTKASKSARWLGLVPTEAFVDRRAADAVVYFPTSGEPGAVNIASTDLFAPTCTAECRAFAAASCRVAEPTLDRPALPSLNLYPPDDGGDHFAIEMIVEKSTANDVLLPITRRRGVTLVAGTGEISITHCYALVQRVLAHRKPTRVLYISDFDPAGACMPVSVARKIEFFVRQSGEDLDIKLVPIALTAEQVRQYALPRTPIKDSEKRKGAFEERHGEGAVELDALEALHPGELARIVNAAIDRLTDNTFEDRFDEAADGARGALRWIEREVSVRHADEIATVLAAHDAMETSVRVHLDAITEQKVAFDHAMAKHVAAFEAAADECKRQFEAGTADHIAAINRATEQWREESEPVWRALTADLEEAAPNIDDVVEWPKPEADEFEDPLYDSGRDYVEQIDRFKRHQQKPTERKARRNGSAP